MTNVATHCRRIASGISFLQGVLFLLIACWAYGIDRTFYAQWIASNVIQYTAFFVAGLLLFGVGYSLLVRRRTAKYLAALLFASVLIWFSTDLITNGPIQPRGLIWLLPPAIALGFLVASWKEYAGERMESVA